ncbi:unnamed protein product [Mytilus edulis]|uniref:Uncharacterized protein n=1 Tax=Mytilus edulis TaxID=6550 RepID=A0A8S3QWY4_MYTED|nr:unnamed protein product [Mytilus edulis]
MNTENYVFKRKGNEEQFKVNTKIANNMKEARSILTESQDNNESTEGAIGNICKDTLGIDAFNRQWGKENNWIVPPPSDISRCIHKIIQDKADSTLFVPLWVSVPYWPLLHKVYGNVVEFESFIKDSKILPSTVIKKGRGRNGIGLKSRVLEQIQDGGILSADFDELGLCTFELVCATTVTTLLHKLGVLRY